MSPKFPSMKTGGSQQSAPAMARPTSWLLFCNRALAAFEAKRLWPVDRKAADDWMMGSASTTQLFWAWSTTGPYSASIRVAESSGWKRKHDDCGAFDVQVWQG
jgi:hypothetical protein